MSQPHSEDWETVDYSEKGISTADVDDSVLIETESTELCKRLQQELKSVKQLFHDTEAELSKANSKIAELEEKLRTTQLDGEAIAKKEESVRESSGHYEKKIAELQAKNATLSKEVDNEKAKASSSSLALKEELDRVLATLKAQQKASAEKEQLSAQKEKELTTTNQKEKEKLKKTIKELNTRIATLEEKLATSKAKGRKAETHNKVQAGPSDSGKLAYRSLAVGDQALFFPTTTGFYVAFTDGSDDTLRHHYISNATMDALGVREKRVEWIILEIVEIVRHRASSEYNPYKLIVGTPFAEIHGLRQ